MSATALQPFLTWFQDDNGCIDLDSLGFTTFPDSEGGRGVVALKDIPEGHVLFTIPRSLTLSTRTSSLPSRFGAEAWKNMKLDQGWTGLILCIMWETANGTSSKWSEYFDTLPTHFETPMFWGEDDLAELDGTSVVAKLGREEAEQSYTKKLLPAIQSRPDLFPPEKVEYYCMANYHLMGSRILSRSFNVEEWASGEEEEEDVDALTNSRTGDMDIDYPTEPESSDENIDQSRQSQDSEAEEEEDEEEGDSSDTAMVPMADMLNARHGSENAKLFYEEHELKMVSTKPIKAGGQIWNTYGDLPNSELLRRYGHVDLLPLPQGGVGNPGDIVEIRADIAVSATTQKFTSLPSESLQTRIDWWLEEGGDDVFVLESDLELPEPLVSFIRLLLLKQGDWETARAKGKPPKPKMDIDVVGIVQDVLETRLKAYPTTLQEDERKLSEQVSTNKKHAIIVRMGEKRILNDALAKIRDVQTKNNSKNKKREGAAGEMRPQKRPRK